MNSYPTQLRKKYEALGWGFSSVGPNNWYFKSPRLERACFLGAEEFFNENRLLELETSSWLFESGYLARVSEIFNQLECDLIDQLKILARSNQPIPETITINTVIKLK